MTPEKDIETIVRGVWAQSGHWPFTAAAEVYIGYRPAQERMQMGSGRIVRIHAQYDIVIFARRGAAQEDMERLRYALYAALIAGGWALAGDPGPETYNAKTEEFMWPVSAAKAFAVGADGMPEDPRILAAGSSGGD